MLRKTFILSLIFLVFINSSFAVFAEGGSLPSLSSENSPIIHKYFTNVPTSPAISPVVESDIFQGQTRPEDQQLMEPVDAITQKLDAPISSSYQGKIVPIEDPSLAEDIIPSSQDLKGIPGRIIPDVQPPTSNIISANIVKTNEDKKAQGINVKLQADTSNGALAMNYPINVPPGRNGLQPDLALNYNSQNNDKDNIFGYGWSVNIPYIERVNKKGTNNLYLDNSFSSSLSGELKGIKIIDGIHGTYGSRVETGDFMTYEYNQDNSWRVKDKLGRIYKFGLNAQSRQDNINNSSQVYRWMLEETRDGNDNFIKYEYFKDEGQIYPSKIKYTGNGKVDGNEEIVFDTVQRVDVDNSYKTAFKVRTNYLIFRIKKYANGSICGYYILEYNFGDSNVHSILSQIIEHSAEKGADLTSPPDKFAYQKNTGNWTVKSSYSIPVDLYNGWSEFSGARVFDVNGDSYADIVFARKNESRKVYINKTDGTGWQIDSNYAVPVDFVNTYADDMGVRIADVNGDGLQDLIKAASDGTNAAVYLNKGNGTGWASDSKYIIPLNFVDQYYTDQGVRIADFNGDGLPDLLKSSPGFSGIYINKGDGTGWSDAVPYDIPEKFTSSGTALADINGDGLVDIMYSKANSYKATYINNGNGWSNDPQYYIPVYFAAKDGGDNGVRIEDANGDGLPDLLYAKDTDVNNKKVYINKGDGTGWSASSQYIIPQPFLTETATSDNGVRLADVDGDGLVDFLYRNDASPVSSGQPPKNTVYRHNGKNPELLINFYNQKGGHTQINYQSGSLYKDALGKLTNPKLSFFLPLVRNIYHFDEIATPVTTKYDYEGGEQYYKSPLDRKFAGFNKIIQTDSAGNTTKTYYHQGNNSDNANGEFLDTYSKIGRPYLVEQDDPSGNVYTKTFHHWKNDLLGNDREFVNEHETIQSDYNGNSDYKAKAEQYSYDPNSGSLLKKTTLWEISTTSNGSAINDIGNDAIITENTYANNTNSNLYAPSDVTMKDQNGNKIAETQYYYDNLNIGKIDKGNLTKQSSWISGNQYVSTTKGYGVYGLVSSENDPLGNPTSYQYDAQNLYPVKITNALNQSEFYTYDYSSGKIKQYTDFNGNKFENIYDNLDRLIEKKQPDPSNPTNLVTSLQYSYYDNVFPRIVLGVNKTGPSGGSSTYTYTDGIGRPIQVRTEIEPNIFSVKDYYYNQLGLIDKESLPYFSNNSAKTTATANGNLYISYTYDPLGRQKTVQNAIGTTSYTYYDWETTINDAENNSKDFFNDAQGNLIKVLEYNEGSSYKTEYQYNGLGKLIKLTDAIGNVQNFGYDGLGRKLIVDDLHYPGDFFFGTHNFTYDDANNLISETDQNAQTIKYAYDQLNRLISEDYKGQDGVEATYSYDSCGNGVGKLCSATAGTVVTTYGYTALGPLVYENRIIDGKQYLTIFNYDWQNNPTIILYPADAGSAVYTYNNAGKIKSIKFADKDIIKNITYSPTGAIATIENANGTTENNTYDANKLYSLTAKSTLFATKPIQNLTYSYDKVGNITQLVDSPQPIIGKSDINKNAIYKYDNLYRLKSATISKTGNNKDYTQDFQYNAIGNITSKTGQGNYSYPGSKVFSYATPHAVTAVGTANFSYDKNGNLLSDDKQNYKWDYKNRMIESTAPSIDIKYSYDHTGERVKKSDGKNWSTYINKFYEVHSDRIIKNIFAGNDRVASIEVGQAAPVIPNEIIYEDAEDGAILGWVPYSTKSTISNSLDNQKQSKVITFQNPEDYGGFKLLKDDGSFWEDTTNKFFNFDFNSKNNIQIALIVDTNQGPKYLEYNSIVAASHAENNYIYLKIDSSLLDGNWHTMTRDLMADINSVSPGTTLDKINYLQIWWMGNTDTMKVDNIKLMTSLDPAPPVTPPAPFNKTIYHHADHLSGSNIDTDETGAVMEMTDYYPFGEIRVDQTTSSYKDTYKFTGKELDPETNLYYYGARYYNPAIGRFVSQDTWDGDIKDPQTLNKYSYVRNNPLRYVDPTGNFILEVTQDPLGGQLPSNTICLGCDGIQNDYKAVNYGKIGPMPEPTSGEKTMAMILGSLATGGMAKEIADGIGVLRILAKNTEAAQKEKPIVIGETMERVIDEAKKNGWDYYKSRPSNPSNYMKNNKNWIQRQIEKGREFIDMGRDPAKVKNNKPVGEYYEMEKNQLEKSNNSVKKL